MKLKDRITEDMKNAMRAKAAARLSTIRLLLAAIKQREVDERRELSDADVVAVLERMVKQRKDSITQFTAGNRLDLADAEQAEIGILETYMPQKMSEAEITEAIDAALAAAKDAGASGPTLMGKVMAALKPVLAG
ncbi:MAG: GatB/YqeY domain-containing protein, partial [Casimicrobiaceae bacterium]